MVGTGTHTFLVVDKRLSAYREDLPHSGGQAKHGKPVSLPSGRYAARQVDSGAGRGRGRKRMPLRNRADRSFVFTALLALPVYFTGEPAAEVVEHLHGVEESLIEEHEDAALFALLMARATGVVALAGLILFRRAERLPGRIVGAVLVLSLATGGLMGWTANCGGRIRHTEIRDDFKAPAEKEANHELRNGR